MRPKSILWFERLYLGAWLVGLLNTVTNWNAVLASAMAQANVAQFDDSFVRLYQGSVVAGQIIPLLLWFFTARMGSVIAKWIVVVVTAVGLVGFLYTLVRGGFPVSVIGVLAAVTLAMKVGAVVMLFRPDAQDWFGETVDDAEMEETLP